MNHSPISAFDRASRVVRFMTHIYLAACGVTFATVLVALTVDITLRYGFNSSILGLHEAVVIAFVYIVLLGSAALYARNEDIVITFFTMRLPDTVQVWVGVGVNVAVASTMGVLLQQTVVLIDAQMQVPTPQLGLPLAIEWIPLAITAASVLATSLVELWAHVLWITTGSRPLVWSAPPVYEEYR